MAGPTVKATFKALTLRKLSEDLVISGDQANDVEFMVGFKDSSLTLDFSSGKISCWSYRTFLLFLANCSSMRSRTADIS